MKLSIEEQNYLLDLYLLSTEELVKKHKHLLSSDSIQEFLALAAHNKISANIFLQLKRLNINIPDELIKPLDEEYQKVKSKNIRRLEVGLPILNEIKKADIEVIILKGNAIAEELFHDIGYKPMNDIDILVKKVELGAIYEIFQRQQLLIAAPLEDDFRKQEKYSHHWPPFFNKKLEVFLGTHWDIAAPKRGLDIPVAAFWKEKEEFKIMGERYFRLCPKHFVLHLCVHLNSAKTGPREIGDLVKVIEKRSTELDPSEFVEMTIQAKAEVEVYQALSLANALRTFPFIEAVLKDLSIKVSEEFKTQVQRRVSPRHKLLHIRTNYISKIEKTFALFTLTESPVEKTLLLAKMWKLYFFVPSEEALRLNYDFPEATIFKKIKASIFAPIKISQVFINDLGFAIFVIITLRHQWVLLISYGEFILKKIKGEPIRNLDSYAAAIGLTFNEIKEISALD